MTIARPPIKRALARLSIGPEPAACWVWTGHRDREGYGRINVAGTPRLVHQITWEAWFGPVANGLELDHFICQNRACANPLHLEPVTHAENMRRARTPFCLNGHSRAQFEVVGKAGRRDCLPCNRERSRVNSARRRAEARAARQKENQPA